MAKTLEEVEMSLNVAKLPAPKHEALDIGKVTVHRLNPRFNGTNNPLGINNRKRAALRQEIWEDGRIMKPIVVLRSKDSAGKVMLEAIIGGTRTSIGHDILADETAPQVLLAELRKTPALVYEGLTDAQILFLANDQDSKKFSFSEFINLIFTLFSLGHKWPEVAMATYQQWYEHRGQQATLNELNGITERSKLRQTLNSKLKGTMDYCFNSAYRIGERAMTAMITEAAERDREIITPRNKREDETVTHAGPYVRLIGNQDRCKSLLVAKEEDVKTNVWNPNTGGPVFNKLWETYHNEDNNLNPDGTPMTAKPEEPKALTRKAIQAIATDSAGSKHSRRVLSLAAGDKDTGWKESDTAIALYEATEDLFLSVAEQIEKKHSEIYKALRNVIVEPDFGKRREYFASLGVTFPAPKVAATEAGK